MSDHGVSVKITSLRHRVLAAVLLMAGSTWAESQANRYYEDAVARLDAGDHRGALLQLRNAVEHDPNLLPARVALGKLYLERGNLEAARDSLLKATELGADPVLVAVPLAQVRNRLGDYRTNLERLRPTAYPLVIQPDLWVELGRSRALDQDTVGAEVAFSEALKIDPAHPGALIGRAQHLIGEGAVADAKVLLERALAQRGTAGAQAWFLMGVVQHHAQSLDDALLHYRRALELDPGHRHAALGEALVMIDQGRLESAARLLEEITQQYPRFLNAHYTYAQVLKRLGKRQSARQAISAAADIVNVYTPADLGDNTGLLLLAANVKRELGEFEGAYRFLAAYAQYRPDDLVENKRLAGLMRRIGKSSEALGLLTRLKVNHPDDVELLVLLGDVNSDLHAYQAAERYYRLALQRLHGNRALQARIGVTQLRQGDEASAITTFSALAGGTNDADTASQVFLAIVHVSRGELDLANELIEQVIDRQPQNLVARNLQATLAIARADYERARSLLTQILQQRSDFQPALINRLRLQTLEKRFDQAAVTAARLRATSPEATVVLVEIARFDLARGDRDAAIAGLQRIYETDPQAVEPALDLVGLYLQSGWHDAAAEIVDRLRDARPDSWRVLMASARVHLANADAESARHVLSDAQRQSNRDPQRTIAVARLYQRAFAPELAIGVLEQLLAARPDAVEARLELATLLGRRNRLAEAERQIDTVLEGSPGNPNAMVLRGDIRMAQGQPTVAAGVYSRVMEIDARPEVVVALARAQFAAGRDDDALRVLETWHADHPQDVSVATVLADHLRSRGDLERARALYEQLAKQLPDNAIIQNNLANLLLKSDFESALVAAQSAYASAPENPSVLDTLGWILVQVGELESGLARLREALAREQNSALIRFHLGIALQEYGSDQAARAQLERALELGLPGSQRQQAESRLVLLQAR